MTLQARRARGWQVQYAEEEIREFDRNLTSAWRSARSTIATAMQATGCDGRKASAGDHLSDMFSDVFGDERARLLANLDEAGGRVENFPWPLTAEKVAA